MNVLNRLGNRLWQWMKKVAAIFWRALVKYDETDGEQRAASFAYYAFFALFPLIVVLVTIGTGFLGSPEHTEETILKQVKIYLPTDPSLTTLVASTLHGVLESRKRALSIAFMVIAWSALRFFQSLVHGVNRAWGTKEYSWWRLPIKNLLMAIILASALLFGTVLPVVVDGIRDLYWDHSWEVGLDFKFMGAVFRFLRWLVAPLVLFYGFSMFYKYAPQRKTLLKEVWSAALFTTASLNALQWLFTFYTKNVANFNVLYGTFGSVLVLLMWIYLSGSIIILGGCLCAARYEIEMHIENQAQPNRAA
ncbi:MAG: Ribonuclease [Chthoniobacteraceae bacterium]|nr:Ribonuclease [Chthoniobacteraceae bacterium]